MQRIIQINIAGRIIPIEEDAYHIIKEYITSLERHFVGDEGQEIIQDIENRIAELFMIRLQNGAPAIDRSDVQKVIDTLGPASELTDGAAVPPATGKNLPVPYMPKTKQKEQQYGGGNYRYGFGPDRLYRNPYDKMLGGVCSGLANYFDIDTVIVRLIFLILFLTAGMGLIAYIVAWIVIPVARTPEELGYMRNDAPMTFHDITQNMAEELKDLKKRGEQMSRDLRDFFSKKK